MVSRPLTWHRTKIPELANSEKTGTEKWLRELPVNGGFAISPDTRRSCDRPALERGGIAMFSRVRWRGVGGGLTWPYAQSPHTGRGWPGRATNGRHGPLASVPPGKIGPWPRGGRAVYPEGGAASGTLVPGPGCLPAWLACLDARRGVPRKYHGPPGLRMPRSGPRPWVRGDRRSHTPRAWPGLGWVHVYPPRLGPGLPWSGSMPVGQDWPLAAGACPLGGPGRGDRHG